MIVLIFLERFVMGLLGSLVYIYFDMKAQKAIFDKNKDGIWNKSEVQAYFWTNAPVHVLLVVLSIITAGWGESIWVLVVNNWQEKDWAINEVVYFSPSILLMILQHFWSKKNKLNCKS